jgi:hypothetical protein
MVQIDEQQSPGLKHRSPSGAQAAPEAAQRRPAQFCEQQSLLVMQGLPMVVQPPATSAAHILLTQLCEQQSVLALQACGVGVHTVVLQVPLHRPLQQAVVLLHTMPAVRQAPPVTAHLPLTVSQAPVQQAAPFTHGSPAAPQERVPSYPASATALAS